MTLNVGGVLYTTTRSTLAKYPDSMLGAMFGGEAFLLFTSFLQLGTVASF